MRVRQDPDVRLQAPRRRVGAEEAEVGPMLRRRAGCGREELPGDELRLLLVVGRRRRRGVVVVVGAGGVALAPEDAELEHGRRRGRRAGAFLRRGGPAAAAPGRLRVQHRRLRRAGVARGHRRRLLRRHLRHVIQIQLHLLSSSSQHLVILAGANNQPTRTRKESPQLLHTNQIKRRDSDRSRSQPTPLAEQLVYFKKKNQRRKR
ncbi:unnamed protein product [Urochloa decumbens]|uniref:Uncharacterized protein n=1 Tax=Urochloa decumbens TaxID=240449 RepID=A0ABC8W5M1_9POAL